MMVQFKYTKPELVYVQSSYLLGSTGMVTIERVLVKYPDGWRGIQMSHIQLMTQML